VSVFVIKYQVQGEIAVKAENEVEAQQKFNAFFSHMDQQLGDV
jgi:hypothetical protein